MGLNKIVLWSRDVFCTQHPRVPCRNAKLKTHLKSRLLAPFRDKPKPRDDIMCDLLAVPEGWDARCVVAAEEASLPGVELDPIRALKTNPPKTKRGKNMNKMGLKLL